MHLLPSLVRQGHSETVMWWHMQKADSLYCLVCIHHPTVCLSSVVWTIINVYVFTLLNVYILCVGLRLCIYMRVCGQMPWCVVQPVIWLADYSLSPFLCVCVFICVSSVVKKLYCSPVVSESIWTSWITVKKPLVWSCYSVWSFVLF